MSARTIRNVIYTAAFIDLPQWDESSPIDMKRLLDTTTSILGPKNQNPTGILKNVYLHHMTIAFRPTIFEYNQLDYGKETTLYLVGIAGNEKAQAFLVETVLPVKNKYPHITISTAEGVSPAYSNQLFDEVECVQLIDPIELKARIGWFDGRQQQYNRIMTEVERHVSQR